MAVVNLIVYQQAAEWHRFYQQCAVVTHEKEQRDTLVKAWNDFGLNPPWCYEPSQIDGDAHMHLLVNGEGRP